MLSYTANTAPSLWLECVLCSRVASFIPNLTCRKITLKSLVSARLSNLSCKESVEYLDWMTI